MNVSEARAILVATPKVLRTLLASLDDAWTTFARPGEWAPAVVLAHFIHAERTDWIPRVRVILDGGGAFPPFDREGHEADAGKPVAELLDTFEALRAESLTTLDGFTLDDAALASTGIHPTFGSVTLAQHIATWAAHDLNHLGQITDEMCRRYTDDVGPWRAFLGVMNRD